MTVARVTWLQACAVAGAEGDLVGHLSRLLANIEDVKHHLDFPVELRNEAWYYKLLDLMALLYAYLGLRTSFSQPGEGPVEKILRVVMEAQGAIEAHLPMVLEAAGNI